MERLPEGFKRIAYDSDSAKFTFRDRNGSLYQGEAGADYGILTPMSASNTASSRPNAFSSGTFSILYIIQLSDSSTVPRHQIHRQYHHLEGRPIVNKSRHSKISYRLTSSLLPLRFPKRARTPSVLSKRPKKCLQLLSKISQKPFVKHSCQRCRVSCITFVVRLRPSVAHVQHSLMRCGIPNVTKYGDWYGVIQVPLQGLLLLFRAHALGQKP